MKMKPATIGVMSCLAFGAAAAAQPMDHSKMAGMKGDPMTMANHDFMSAMKKMDQSMMAAKGGSVDATFARKLIAHHQGAIDMAKIELQHGADAQAKQQAQKTIEENRRGVEELRSWLRDHGG